MEGGIFAIQVNDQNFKNRSKFKVRFLSVRLINWNIWRSKVLFLKFDALNCRNATPCHMFEYADSNFL